MRLIAKISCITGITVLRALAFAPARGGVCGGDQLSHSTCRDGCAGGATTAGVARLSKNDAVVVYVLEAEGGGWGYKEDR